jgi:cytochrome c biogenesis factor
MSHGKIRYKASSLYRGLAVQFFTNENISVTNIIGIFSFLLYKIGEFLVSSSIITDIHCFIDRFFFLNDVILISGMISLLKSR